MSMPKQHNRGARSRPQGGQSKGLQHGKSSELLEYITAPYNFVPLSDRIFIPDWGKNVSHDIPFEDGVCGELHYSLIAESPLLVGGCQTKSVNDKPGEVKPFQLTKDCYAIPGSSIKGMLRNVLEIAGFGRMRQVDEIRPGLRDISKADTVYTERVRGKVKTGFLQRKSDGSHEIIPCAMNRLEHRDLEKALGISQPIFPHGKKTVKEKYALWHKLRGENSNQISFEPGNPNAMRLFNGPCQGTPVFTGQISDSTKPRGKHRDFVFYAPEPDQPIAVSSQVWRDFLRIHGDEEGKQDMSWPGYWKEKYRAGDSVPVFYIHDNELLRIGLAYMPKLAGDFSTHDLIRHANPDHLREPGEESGYDLADLLFGAINADIPSDALRGRVSCDMAIAEDAPKPNLQPPTILNSPKPSYFPNYISQPVNPNDWRLKEGSQYATYIETKQSKAPILRGFKRYPVRPLVDAKVQPLTSDQSNNKNVQVVLHTLPATTVFKGRLIFHNLNPVELGALFWVLTWGGNPVLRHSLGMGKSFGFGQVRFELSADHGLIIPNDPDRAEYKPDVERQKEFMQQFRDQMCAVVQDWENSAQLSNLTAMANSDNAAQWTKKTNKALCHMRLSEKEFLKAKQEKLVLADYATAVGVTDVKNFRPLKGRSLAASTAVSASTAVEMTAGSKVEKLAFEETVEHWTNVILTWNKGSKTLKVKATAPNKGSTQESQENAEKWIKMLPPEQKARLEKRGELNGVNVSVTVKGNAITLKNLTWPTAG
jgi:CRISPR-associated protein (TIGR03986 family)